VLSRSRSLFARGHDRLRALRSLYDPNTTQLDREAILNRLRQEGVWYAATDAGAVWAGRLSWPVVLEHGRWQLRRAPSD